MSKASEIMERLDAIDPDEAIGDDKDMFYFRAVDALIKALTGNEIWWTSPLQDGIAEIREALREAFGELEARALPDGCEWPRYEDGEPVRIGDEYECWCGKAHFVRSVTIKDGRSVLNESQSHSFVVSDGHFTSHGERVKRTQVLAADGEPLDVGDTVWNETGVGFKVEEVNHNNKSFVAVRDFDGNVCKGLNPLVFTHTKPEQQDSWERIEEDARLMLDDGLHDNDEWVLDLVRRCKKLAEKESK